MADQFYKNADAIEENLRQTKKTMAERTQANSAEVFIYLSL